MDIIILIVSYKYECFDLQLYSSNVENLIINDSRLLSSENDEDFIVRQKLSNAVNDREELSKRLNQMMKEMNILKCRMNNATTDTGAWCRQAVKTKHFTDERLALSLAIMFENKTVASFGDGPGEYKTLVEQTDLVRSYTSYDGSPFVEEDTAKRVKYLDLTVPHFGLPVFDWIVSLEVAEHVPAAYEDTYVSNIVRHARDGVVLSWAVPHQIGVDHVNPRDRNYVVRKMQSYCFDFDLSKSNKLKRMATIAWLKKNILVFRRRLIECPFDANDA
uniref:Methyltransferase type 11 domain-containing protein n=1 Tax=Romanomermis culicivorax TaxID=13658 RepID=A0A915HM12_ROMCU